MEHRDLRCTLALSVGPLCQAEIIRLSPLTLWSFEINTTSCQGSCSTVENLEWPLSLLRVQRRVSGIDVVHHAAVQQQRRDDVTQTPVALQSGCTVNMLHWLFSFPFSSLVPLQVTKQGNAVLMGIWARHSSPRETTAKPSPTIATSWFWP